MRIGYACLTVGVPDANLKTCMQKNATPETLKELIAHNLCSLERMLDYNLRQDIRLFRISSDIIPFGSSPVNTLDWPALFAEPLQAIGEKALTHGMRLSMHPGQYTVLNSPNAGVVERAVADLVVDCGATWTVEDGPPKTHYSQQAAGKKPGSHSGTIDAETFLAYCGKLRHPRPDIMLEVKDKNLSAVKCINLAQRPPHIKWLEQEWGRYKYSILAHSPSIYQAVRELLKDKRTYPAPAFYALIGQALAQPPQAGHQANAAQHVWGHLKERASEGEKRQFEHKLNAFSTGNSSIQPLRNYLRKLAVRYEETYLLQSLYFDL